MFPTGEELRRGLAAVVPLFSYNDSGLGLLGRDGRTALRSFLVMTLTLPPFAVQLLVLQRDQAMEPLGLHFVLVWLLGYIVAWTLLPLLLIEFGKGKDFADRVPHFISAYNWLALPVAYLRFLAEILPLGLGGFLAFLLTMYIFSLEWFLARRLLGLSGLGAAALVALAFFLNVLVIVIATDMTELVPKLGSDLNQERT
ncbi:MAG: hypothetical protein Kilf2KO_03830 [Rhodospirillales bacterium]